MDTQAATKLDMYKAVETVCLQHHGEWNNLPEFGSAFSRFAVKVAQLDLLTDETAADPLAREVGKRQNKALVGEHIRKLLFEIDALLRTSIDSFVKFLRSEHRDFYSMYVSARTSC